MSDCLIVGGGVIGLSLAYELAGHGCQVRVIDSGTPGRRASWAGAGILPPAFALADDPLERLTDLSNALHAAWSADLRAATGIDNGYRRCGAIYLARDVAETQALEFFAASCMKQKTPIQRLARETLGDVEPALLPSDLLDAYLVNDECQIRNPRHLKALLGACATRGVEVIAGAMAEDFDIRADRIRGVRTTIGTLAADQVCISTGSWSGPIGKKLGVAPAIQPIRGQMALLTLASPAVRRIINEGKRYLVPRCDGRLLAGSTEEDVGFDRSTTAGVVSDLLQFAVGLVPALAGARLERTWSGFRPATRDGRPYLGRIPHLKNAFMAAGHFRSGLQLSTGTARVMGQLMRGEEPEIDLSLFRVDRDSNPDLPRGSQRARRELPIS